MVITFFAILLILFIILVYLHIIIHIVDKLLKMTYNTHSNEWRKATIFFHIRTMTTPQPNIPPDTRYKVLTYSTMGWTLADDQAVNLKKSRVRSMDTKLDSRRQKPRRNQSSSSEKTKHTQPPNRSK